MADKDLQVYLGAVTRLHERFDAFAASLASKADVERVEDAVNELNSAVAKLQVKLVGNYVTKEDAEKRCETCEKKSDAEGKRRRWVAGYTVTVAMAVIGFVTLLWRLFG